MYQQPYTEYIKENPDSPFSKFLIRFFSAKPDFTELDKEIEKEQKILLAEQKAEIQRRLAEKKAQKQRQGVDE